MQDKNGSIGASAYEFDGTKFFDHLSDNSSEEWMYSMVHTKRGRFQGDAKKCIQSSDLAMFPYNHGNEGCIESVKNCFTIKVDPKDGYFLHYRNNWKVNYECEDGKCVEYDPIVLKYKTRLEYAMKNVFAQIA